MDGITKNYLFKHCMGTSTTVVHEDEDSITVRADFEKESIYIRESGFVSDERKTVFSMEP